MDEALSDVGLLAFRKALLDALARGDVEAVLGMMAEDVKASHEGLWRGMSPHELPTSPLSEWVSLRNLLTLGGTFTTTRGAKVGRREFCAPYIYSAFPERPVPQEIDGEGDPKVILGEGVPVFAAMSTRSRILTRLSYALVQAGGVLGPDADGSMWVRVELLDGLAGYVMHSQIRAPNDYHACFADLDGRWQMTRIDRGISPR